MYLNESLRICLLALVSRYPHHTLDINPTIVKIEKSGAQGWTARQLIEQLETVHPELLQTPSSLLIDQNNSVIYLLESSKQEPAISVHCGDRMPVSPVFGSAWRESV